MFKLVALAVVGLVSDSVSATTFTIDWHGADGRSVTYPGAPGIPGFTEFDFAQESGTGTLTLADGVSSAVGLSDVLGFNLTTSLTYTASGNPYYNGSFTQTTTYDLPDLLSFSLISPVGNGIVANFSTDQKAGSAGVAERFTNSGNFGTSSIGGTPLTPEGDVTLARVQGAVPEPATWATMFMGLTLIAGSLRRRQQKCVSA